MRIIFVVIVLFAGLSARADPGPQLVYAPVTPAEGEYTESVPPPNGEPEPVRYLTSYRAFWWNCVMVKAEDLTARCPHACSGTVAATYGCSDGEMDAYTQIRGLLEHYPRPDVRRYLRSYVAENDAAGKIKPYFNHGPKPFVVDLQVE